jgi:hypothetical protein
MGRIKDYFVERGLTPADFPVAFVFHEVISVGWAGAVWGACYGIQPSVTVCRPLAKLPMASRVSGAFDKALTFSDAKLEKMPAVKHAHPRRLTVSLAESLVFRGAVKPVSFGAKLYFSYQFVLWTKKARASLAAARERKEAEQASGSRPTMVRKNGRWVRETPAALTLALPPPWDGKM